MNPAQATPESSIVVNPDSPILTHAHSFALRQAILSQLNNCQKAEHDSLNTMRAISTNHTKGILEILTQWLCAGYVQASQEEIEEIQGISSVQHDEWLKLTSRKDSLDQSLEVTAKEFGKAKQINDDLGGFLGKNEWLAKGDKKIEILEAKTNFERLKNKLAELEKDLRETNGAIKSYGDTFLENCCKNLEKISGESSFGQGLRAVVQATTNTLSEEWFRHCKQQQQELESIEANITRLKRMYSLGETS